MHDENGAPIPTDDLLPDDLLARHLGGADAEEGSADPNPAARTRSPAPAATDTSDFDFGDDDDFEDPDADDADTDGDEAGEEEPVDAEDDEDSYDDDDDFEDEDGADDEDLDDSEDEETEDEEGTEKSTRKASKGLLDELPKFDRQKLESAIKQDKTGELGKAYKHLQALATRKTTEAAEIKAQAQRLRQDFDAFQERVATPEGARDYMTEVVLANPAIAAAAFEAVALGEGAVDFLVEVGLSKPELIEQAFDRVQELQQDPAERQRHIRERETSTRDAQLRRREARLASEEQARADRRITRLVTTAAEKAGLDEVLQQQVQERVQAKRAAGATDISQADVREIVRAVKKQAAEIEERVRLKLQRESARSRREQVKQSVRKGRRPAPPGPRAPAPAKQQRREIPKGVDPLDFAVDRAATRVLNRS